MNLVSVLMDVCNLDVYCYFVCASTWIVQNLVRSILMMAGFPFSSSSSCLYCCFVDWFIQSLQVKCVCVCLCYFFVYISTIDSKYASKYMILTRTHKLLNSKCRNEVFRKKISNCLADLSFDLLSWPVRFGIKNHTHTHTSIFYANNGIILYFICSK